MNILFRCDGCGFLLQLEITPEETLRGVRCPSPRCRMPMLAVDSGTKHYCYSCGSKHVRLHDAQGHRGRCMKCGASWGLAVSR